MRRAVGYRIGSIMCNFAAEIEEITNLADRYSDRAKRRKGHWRSTRSDEGLLIAFAEDLCMDRTSLYRAMRPLERDGWIKIQDGPDGRSRQARTTAVGARVLDAAAPRWNEMQHAIVRRFGVKAWGELVKDISRLSLCIPTSSDA